MKVVTVQEYNRLAMIRYDKAVSEHKFGQGGFPFIGFYVFHQKYGYVASNGTSLRWAKTKKGAIARFEGENNGHDHDSTS